MFADKVDMYIIYCLVFVNEEPFSIKKSSTSHEDVGAILASCTATKNFPCYSCIWQYACSANNEINMRNSCLYLTSYPIRTGVGKALWKTRLSVCPHCIRAVRQFVDCFRIGITLKWNIKEHLYEWWYLLIPTMLGCCRIAHRFCGFQSFYLYNETGLLSVKFRWTQVSRSNEDYMGYALFLTYHTCSLNDRYDISLVLHIYIFDGVTRVCVWKKLWYIVWICFL